MASTYPTSIDTFNNPLATTKEDAATFLHHTEHSDANDAIHNIETKVGIDASTVTTSLDWQLRARVPSVTVFKIGTTTYAVRYDMTLIDSGTNSKTVINSAVDNIASTADVTGGGTVFIRAGLYNITGK